MMSFQLPASCRLYALQRLQNLLPLNPRGFDARARPISPSTPPPSFITNTNWQSYGGETTMSHLTQMLGLTVHNFLSAATGLAMAFALVRGFARSSAHDGGELLGRCYARHSLRSPADLVHRRFALVALGMPQTLAGAVDATTLEGAKQTISIGPVASQEIDQGTRHQRRRLLQRQLRASVREPQRLDQHVGDLGSIAHPFASVLAFGRVGRGDPAGTRHSRAMAVFVSFGVVVAYWSEAPAIRS